MLGTLNGIRVRWSMRVLRWVKQSLCSLSVLNVGWEDGEGEGAELLEGICWCYANHVCHIAVKVCRVAGHPVEVCRVAGHRAEMRRVAGHRAEMRRVAGHRAEMRRVAGHPVEVRRVAVEMHHLAAHLVESRHLSGRAAEVCRLTDRAMEVRRPTDRAAEVRRLTDRAMEVRRLSAEMRHLAEHLADFAVKQGSSCLYSLGTASMYCFFLFAFTRQLESPFTCHQIVSNGSLQATRVQSSAAATPNGRVRIGEDEGVPERKAYTQSLQ